MRRFAPRAAAIERFKRVNDRASFSGEAWSLRARII